MTRTVGTGKTIFMFRHYATTPSHPGGSQHFLLSQCMVEDGHEVFLFASNFNHSSNTYAREFKGNFLLEKTNGVNFVWINNKPKYISNGLKRLLGMLDYSIKAYLAAIKISKTYKKPNVIIGSVAHSFAVLAAWLFSLRRKIPLWIDISELWPEAYIEAGVLSKFHPLALILGFLAQFLYKKGEVVTVINPNTRDFISQKRGVDKEKVIVFIPGFIAGETAMCSPRSRRNAVFRLTYTGALNELYPIDELLRAAVKVGNLNHQLEIEIVGDGSRKAYLMTLTAELGLSDIVKFKPPVTKGELWDIYQKADVLLVIEKNVKYGFPSKLLDYFNAGRPVIIASDANYSLPPDVFMQCRPTAADFEVQIMKLIMMTETDLNEIGENSFKFAANNYDTKAMYKNAISPLLNTL